MGVRHQTITLLSLTAMLAAGICVAALTATPLSAAGILPPANPVANIAPSPDFDASGACTSIGSDVRCSNPCVSETTGGFPAFDEGQSCTRYVLRAINAARATEHVRAMVLPTNWRELTVPEQLFVLADSERTARGLPPYLGLNQTLSSTAQRAATLQQDPQAAVGFPAATDADGALAADGTLALSETDLEADYVWMYDDGWGDSSSRTFNIDCVSASAPGCWGHRDAILGSYDHQGVGLHCRTCEMGAGFAIVRGKASFTDLLERPSAAAPPMFFTWVHDVVPFLQDVPGR